MLVALSSLAGSAASKPAGGITLGFSQVGSESGWRAANTKSVQSSAKAAGIKLKFSDAQQKQENQIKAIRSYIQQKVNVIAFSPVVESGWDAVLNEAKRAHIPVILTDRAVDSKDPTLYKTFLGSDFVKEGKEAGQWVLNNYKNATTRSTSSSSRERQARRLRSTARPASPRHQGEPEAEGHRVADR